MKGKTTVKVQNEYNFEDVYAMNNYTNLQPLWKTDNQKKYYADLETHNE